MTDETVAVATIGNPLSASLALSSGEEWIGVEKRWAKMIANGGAPAHIKTPAQAICATRFGDAFGWDEMRSVRSVYVVKGSPTLKTEAMVALVHEKLPHAEIEILESTDQACRVRGRRSKDHPWNPAEFTLAMAKRANLLSNPTWRSYPEVMLRWRALSQLCRFEFSDATNGAYTREEAMDAEWTVSQGVPTSNTLPASMLPPVEAEPVAPCDLCGGVGEHDVDCPHWVDDSPPVITPGGGSDGGARPPSGDGGAT